MNINTLEFIHELLKSTDKTTHQSSKEEMKKKNECENVVRKLRYEENYEELTKAKENLSYASEKYNVAYEMFQRAHSALMDFEDHEF